MKDDKESEQLDLGCIGTDRDRKNIMSKETPMMHHTPPKPTKPEQLPIDHAPRRIATLVSEQLEADERAWVLDRPLPSDLDPHRIAALMFKHLEADERGWVLAEPQTLHPEGYASFTLFEGFYGETVAEALDEIYDAIGLQSPDFMRSQFAKSGYDDIHPVEFTYISMSGARITERICDLRLDSTLHHWITYYETILDIAPPRGSSGKRKRLIIPRHMWGRDKLHATEKVRAYASGVLDEQCRAENDRGEHLWQTIRNR